MNKEISCKVAKLQALYDGELDVMEREQVLEHVLDCEGCRKKYEQIRWMSSIISSGLQTQTDEPDPLATQTIPRNKPEKSFSELDVNRAFQRFVISVSSEPKSKKWDTLLNQSDKETVMEQMNVHEVRDVDKLTGPNDKDANPGGVRKPNHLRKWMPRLGISVAAIALCAGLFTTSAGNRVLAEIFQTFYVQNIVGLNPQDVAMLENEAQKALGDGHGNINLERYGRIQVTSKENPTSIPLNQAEKLVHYDILPLTGSAKETSVEFTPERTVVLRFNVRNINSLLLQMGATTKLPDSVNGQPIVLNFPAEVVQNVTSGSTNMTLLVSKVPNVQVPDGIDLNSIRNAVLKMPFVPQDMKIQLAANPNWQTTAYLPFSNGTVKNVAVKGVQMVIHTADSLRMVLWIQDGKLYELKGNLSTFPTDDAILQAAAKVMR